MFHVKHLCCDETQVYKSISVRPQIKLCKSVKMFSGGRRCAKLVNKMTYFFECISVMMGSSRLWIGENSMAYVISVVNQKGGVGKTTTTINLSAYLALKGKKVLVIDLDPQGNATSGYGFDKSEIEASAYDLLINEATISEVIQSTDRKNVEMCPTNINLAGAEVELVSAMSRETILKSSLETVLDKYDFVLIDCPPSLGLLTINALAASSGVLVPIQGEYYALEGLTQLIDTINLVKKHLNPQIGVFGVVITMYDGRTQLTRQVAAEVRKYFGEKVFDTVIPRNVRLAEAPSFGKTIAEYDPKSKGGLAYAELAKEVIKRAKDHA